MLKGYKKRITREGVFYEPEPCIILDAIFSSKRYGRSKTKIGGVKTK